MSTGAPRSINSLTVPWRARQAAMCRAVLRDAPVGIAISEHRGDVDPEVQQLPHAADVSPAGEFRQNPTISRDELAHPLRLLIREAANLSFIIEGLVVLFAARRLLVDHD